MLALAIRRPERRVPPSRAGWTEGALAALELAVKERRDSPAAGPTSTSAATHRPRGALPPARCARCHAEHAARDNVFVQFYPQLRDR